MAVGRVAKRIERCIELVEMTTAAQVFVVISTGSIRRSIRRIRGY